MVISLDGSPANVLLVDRQNFVRYRAGLGFSCVGGFRRDPPVHLSVPYDGHWYVAMDLGGQPGHTRGAVKLVSA